MNIHTRIKERRLALDLNHGELAKLVGVARETARQWELSEGEGGTAPARSRIKIVAKHLKVNAEWLLTGNDANLKLDGRYVFIPLYSPANGEADQVKFFAGVSQLGDDDKTVPYAVDYMEQNGLDPAYCRVIKPTDDSMDIGSQVLIDTADKKVKSGRLYFLDSLGGPRVRRLYTG